MVTDHREIEDKYDVDAGTPVPSLDGLPGVASVHAPVDYDLEATYFDTSGLALLGERITVRRRTGGSDAGWHLKLPAAEGRHEVQVPLSRATRTVPKVLRGAVHGLVRDQVLAPVATLRTHRTAYQLVDVGGAVLAELTDDRVVAQVPSADGTEVALTSWREWEVELVEGDRSLLEAAAEVLRTAGAEPSRWPSKLVRALGERLPPPPAQLPKPRKKGPVSAVVQARLAEQVAELRARDPLVRRDVPDAVHKMRVAIRRLRGALATFRPFLDREVTDPLRDELRLLGLALSGARDAEVVHERIADLLSAERADLVRGPVLRQVNADLARRYRAAHAHAVGVMESEGYFELLAALDRLAADPPFTKGARRRVADVLPGRVRHDWKRLAERVGAVGGAADPAERDRRLHDVRKAAKRLRYASEPLVQLYGADAEALVAAAKSIQKVLGDHQDGVLVQAILLQLADESTAAGHDDFTFGLLYAREQMAAERSLAEFEDTWRAATRKRLRRWLR